MGSLGGGGGDDGIEGIGKSASSLLGNVTKLLGKNKNEPAKLPGAVPSEEAPKVGETEAPEAPTSEGVDKDSVYKRGGRAKKAYGGGFGQWLAGLQSGQSNAPYMNPSYQGSKAPYLPQEAPSQPAQKPAISNIDELYQYAFNRAPDEAGRQFWSQQQQAGMSLGDIAKTVMGSEEAKGKYEIGRAHV